MKKIKNLFIGIYRFFKSYYYSARIMKYLQREYGKGLQIYLLHRIMDDVILNDASYKEVFLKTVRCYR
jgi:hypothetical protein